MSNEITEFSMGIWLCIMTRNDLTAAQQFSYYLYIRHPQINIDTWHFLFYALTSCLEGLILLSIETTRKCTGKPRKKMLLDFVSTGILNQSIQIKSHVVCQFGGLSFFCCLFVVCFLVSEVKPNRHYGSNLTLGI